MMRFSPNLKKALLIGTIILLGCDVSLFTAENSSGAQTNTSAPSDNPQLQQLQAQIDSLQKPAPDPTAAAAPAAATVASQNPTDQPAYNPAVPANSNNAPAASPPPEAKLPSIEGAQLPPTAPNNGGLPAYQPQQVAAAPQQTNLGGQQANGGQNYPTAPAGVAAPTDNGPPKNISDKDINDVAFNNMVQNSLPMSPDQIQKLRSAYMASQFSAANVPGIPPRPTATSVFVDLSPGATPPVVRLGQGFVTSLVFVDTTGAPWPIESYDVGNPTAFNIQWDKVSNTLMIQSAVLYTYGNLAIKLKGLNTPVMITLIPGQKAIDYRVDIRVPGYGPAATPFTPNTLPAGSSPDLLNILDGVPPPNSTTLIVDGGNCQAWLSGQKMYVRTRLNVLSPGWSATLSSADGMHAYQMQPTPMLLVSQNGQVVQLKVQGF